MSYPSPDINAHSHHDDMQLYCHLSESSCDILPKCVIVCISSIEQCLTSNGLKSNMDKNPDYLAQNKMDVSKVQSRCKSVRISDADITFSNEVICLGVIFDQELTFLVHIRHLSQSVSIICTTTLGLKDDN